MRNLIHHVAGIWLGAAVMAGPALAEPVKLRFTSYAPAGNFVNEEVIRGYMDRVVADSENTITYQLFPGGTLGRNPAEQLKLVQDGVADIGFIVPAFTPGAYDLYSVVELPGLARNAVEAALILADAQAAGLLEIPDRTRVLGVFSSDMNGIHLRDGIGSLEGLAGKRLRVNGTPAVAGAESLGAVPVSGLSSTEVAEGISRGTIDGTVMGAASLDAFRASEVTTMHLRVPMGASALMFPMNANTWNNLPEPAKKAFEKHGGSAFAEIVGAIFKKYDEAAFAKVTAMPGHSAFAVDEEAFAQKIGDIGPKWASLNPQRQAVYDSALKTLERVRGQ